MKLKFYFFFLTKCNSISSILKNYGIFIPANNLALTYLEMKRFVFLSIVLFEELSQQLQVPHGLIFGSFLFLTYISYFPNENQELPA